MGFTNAEPKKAKRPPKAAKKELEKVKLLNIQIKDLKAENKKLRSQAKTLTHHIEKLKSSKVVALSKKKTKAIEKAKVPQCPKCSKDLKTVSLRCRDKIINITSCKACGYKTTKSDKSQ